MAKRKMKKKTKRRILIVLLIIVILVAVDAFLILRKGKEEGNVQEAKVVSKIEGFGYNLKDDKSDAYKKLFKELKTELSKKEIDEEKYAKIITEMFIVDFYSLNDRKAKTDIGGTDIVYSYVLDNFVLNAQDTFYKYVESNIYGDRDQDLPTVDKVTIDEVKNDEFAYYEQVDENAVIVKASWTYKDSSKAKGYPTEGTFTFIHEGLKLCLVEVS